METIRSFGNFVIGPGFVPQLLLVVVIMLVFYTVVTIIETFIDGIRSYKRQAVTLLQDTYTSTQTIAQNLDNKDTLLYPSVNEVHGLEFSYACHLFIDPETFQGNGATNSSEVRLKHVFHKGSANAWPLLGPGVFVNSQNNALRIYMNSSKDWNNYVEIDNMPVGKWFHLVITQKGQYMDIYINGNIKTHHEFSAVPKINYGNVYVMSSTEFPTSGALENMRGEDGKAIVISGPMKGMVSRLRYYAYALNYSQIDSLYREGPSKVIVSPSFSQKPPYFRDDWWVTDY
jgi:hypothetical protein